jgi:SAM-dependent methyltransferase
MTTMSFASSIEPKHHPDCCMAISQSLLHNLANLLPHGPAISVLSIGSGTGLLESMLSDLLEDSYDVCGVEVSPNVNKYLPEQNMFFVGGTWDFCSQAGKSHVWMFTYPREPKLVMQYLKLHGHANLSKIIWLGPKMDWQDYEGVFSSSRFSHLTILKDCGAAAYEMVAVAEPQT